MKYRKKPIVIEAIQWTGENMKEIFHEFPRCFGLIEEQNFNKLIITTLEGRMMASIGDYIIEGIKGEYYPCKPDIFEASYERIDHE